MRLSKFTKGFSIVEVLIILGVVVLIGGVGFVGWKALMSGGENPQTAASTSKSAEIITTKADLEAAEKALDELDFEDESAIEAESQATL